MEMKRYVLIKEKARIDGFSTDTVSRNFKNK